jgi:anthranilate phosphoribosyltransferase
LEQDQVSLLSIAPEDAGLPRASIASLKGGSAEENARAIRALFEGAKTPFRNIVLLNAAAALIVADKVSSLSEGVARAAQAVDTGAANRTLEASMTAKLVPAT